MADDYYYRISTSQDQLRYAYEDGQNHMKYHPDVVEEYRQIIEKHPHFKSEKEALQWAKIGKKDGVYRNQDWWKVTNDWKVLLAVDYLGLVQVYTEANFMRIIRNDVDIDDIIQ